jgi:hypothetical protein
MNKKFYMPRRRFEQVGDGGTPGGGAPVVPVAPAGGTPAPDGGTPPAPAWYDSFQDNETKEWLKSYNAAYPNPESVAVKARNLEKFVGAEKSGRGVIMPKPDAPAEEWQSFYKKVGGVPEKPDGYALPKDLAPEVLTGLSADPMVTAFREHAHKTGMPPAFFEASMKFYAEHAQKQEETFMNEFLAKSEKDMDDLKAEWPGIEYDKNVELGRRAAAQFIPHQNKEQFQDVMNRIEGALGTKETMKLWASIGAALGEDGFEGGQGNGSMTGMTPEAARVRISTLKSDAGFVAKLTSGDAASKAEWDQLHKTAYPSS